MGLDSWTIHRLVFTQLLLAPIAYCLCVSWLQHLFYQQLLPPNGIGTLRLHNRVHVQVNISWRCWSASFFIFVIYPFWCIQDDLVQRLSLLHTTQHYQWWMRRPFLICLTNLHNEPATSQNYDSSSLYLFMIRAGICAQNAFMFSGDTNWTGYSFICKVVYTARVLCEATMHRHI